jgi:hypothetical protein
LEVLLRNNGAMDSSTSSSSGPYPKSDRNDELQELSFRAFQNALPVHRFVFRDERGKDKGVDGSLELKIDSGFTNLRGQVQLKGTDSGEVNADGSVSVQVKTSNLVYLNNGLCPIYSLYVVPRNELRFLWAREEFDRLNQENPDWRQQGTVTLRLRHILTPDALDQIHDRIRREAQLLQHIHELLGRASSNERVVTAIDPATLANTDPDEIYRLLLTSGATIVAAGYAGQVKEMAGFLNPASAQSPRIQLIRAYAEYTLGRYQFALGNIAEASLRFGELSSEDQQFLTFVRDGCEYQTGRISLSELAERIDDRIKQGTGVIPVLERLNRKRVALLGETDIERRGELLTEFRGVVDEILTLDVGDPFKLLARLLLAEAEGHQSIFASYSDIAHNKFLDTLGRSINPEEVADAQIEKYYQWEETLAPLLRDAVATNNPLVLANALLIKTTVRAGYLANSKILAFMFNASVRISETWLHAAMADAEQAMKIHAQAGQLEGELRAKLALADLFMFAEQEAAAHQRAKDVLPKAQAMDYAGIASHAQDIISGHTLAEGAEAWVSAQFAEDPDYSIATESEETLRRFARESHEALGLPPEMLPLLELEALALRDIAHERLEWCRHIDLIQEDLRARVSDVQPSAAASTPRCICLKFGYEVERDNADWKDVIAVFKERHCAECPARSPKRQED